ncbi:MAG: hypothetical protein JSU96_13975, partial [Acidobacteriota bacterium]
MRPRLLELFSDYGVPGWLVPDYWLLVTLAIIVTCLGTLHLWNREGEGDTGAQDLLLIGIPAVFIGARFF